MSYGSTLTAFSGDFISVAYYQALAGFDSGPGAPQTPATVRGILQCVERRIKESDGNVADYPAMKFWTRKTLNAGWFIRDKKEIIYRFFLIDNEWIEEGGFTVYGLERVVGDNGNATLDPDMSVGTGHFRMTATTEAVLEGILATILACDSKYVIPRQGNWYNPQDNTADPLKPDTWCGYAIEDEDPFDQPFYYRTTRSRRRTGSCSTRPRGLRFSSSG